MTTLTPDIPAQTLATAADHAVSSPASALSSSLPSSLTPADLADLLGAFNEASLRLQRSHEVLQAEVLRLKSELKNANEALERSRRLAALGEMAAGISHEVRNPLGSIRLYAKMLFDDLPDRPAERDLARKISSAVNNLDAVVGDVLAFAREIRLAPDDLDPSQILSAALAEAIDGLSLLPAISNLHVIRADLACPDAPPILHADPSLTHRALVNVVRNALQAFADSTPVPTSRPAHVLVLDAQRRTTLDSTGAMRDWCVLSVRDTAGGVPSDALQRIFNPFFTTRAAGTGLGLPIVHRIMDAHAGKITIKNVPPASLHLAGLHHALPAGALVELSFPAAPRSQTPNP